MTQPQTRSHIMILSAFQGKKDISAAEEEEEV